VETVILILGILLAWLVHLCIAVILSIPVAYFSRRRVPWHRLDLLAFIIPFFAWYLLIYFGPDKGFLNCFLEPVLLALAVFAATLIRVVIGNRIPEKRCRAGLIGSLTLLTIGIYFLVPSLPN